MLLAAAMHADTADPTADITSYMVVNNILTSNVRSDSGQANTWRDYQQMLSELGLIYSTEVLPAITPTGIGLAFLDNVTTYAETMTLQALRYQYPNGHKLAISPALRRALAGTPHASAATVAGLQEATGMQIRPGVLIWQVIRQLRQRGFTAELTVSEIHTYLSRCTTHADTESCVLAIISARQGGPVLPPLVRGRRSIQEWIRLLDFTPLFEKGEQSRLLRLTTYALAHAEEINAICDNLENPVSFWTPGALDAADRKTWYSQFGSLNIDLGLIPQEAETRATAEEEDEIERLSGSTGAILLRDFDETALGATAVDAQALGRTITSTYDAGMANSRHRLHDLMVIYIARICRDKGAHVYDDPNSVDLLINYQNDEYIVEVKSATPRNFVGRLRYALGQVLEYDYRRSRQVQINRRKVIAIAAQVARASWSVPFLNDHLDIDMLSLQGQLLRVDSHIQATHDLFTPSAPDPTLSL